MLRKLLVIILSIFASTALFLPALAGEIDFALHEFLLQKSADEMTPVIVIMADRINTSEVIREMRTSRVSIEERHETLINDLRYRAESTQRAVIDKIQSLKAAGEVSEFTPLWISNIIGVTATYSAINEIASIPEVETIIYDAEIDLIEPVDEPKTGLSDDIQSVEIGLEAIRADEVWDMGITGEGVIVCHLDTGAEGEHPALAERWRGLDPRYSENPEWAWHDPLTSTDFPFDDSYHGTHTMGTICGADHNSGDTVGVAIGAEWICAGVVDRGGDLPTRMLRYMLSFQWVADPDGDPSTTWDVPAVCSNSWGHSLSGFPNDSCNAYYWETLDNLEAVGVAVVFAAGNEGSAGLRVPGNRETDDYNSFAVGAIDARDPGYPIASFSARGPSYCTPDGQAAIKPEVVAPGVSVNSCYPGGSYSTLSGTSMACPHVAGAIALIKQANPHLAPEEIKQILMDTAVDLGIDGEDNTYGWGIIDVYEAVNVALARLEGYGFITGRITDLTNGNPLPGSVTTINRPDPITGNANSQGYYGIWLPSDTLWNVRADFLPDYLPSFNDIMVSEYETLTVNFVLEPKAPIVLRASFGNPDDIAYRTFYCKGSWTDDGFHDPAWSSSMIPMSDDGIYPDATEGDGIFSGLVRLATDLTNTYQWGVYSEDYTDDALLQEGDDFVILDPGNPPTVPVLSVNPSGTEHNWTLTVLGNYDLLSELEPDYLGFEYKWSGTATLDAGVTYNFRIYPMHEDIASYGRGGVGGQDFSVTPNLTDEYTFIFNDNNDSLEIDSAHPSPSGLIASDDRDMEIYLDWEAPWAIPESYRIYRSDNETGPFTQIETVTHPTLNFMDESVVNYHDYYYYVTAVFTGNIESLPSNTDLGYALTGARLSVNPEEFDVGVEIGGSTTREMYIINEGDLDLEYSIEVFEDRILSASNPDHNSPEPFTCYHDDYDKTSIEDDPRFPPQILDSGGPDEYGYSWVDSDDPNGPVYNWIDISQRGTQVVLNDDENQGPFPLDFGATFYGNLFEDFRICSNGFVSFTATQTEYSNFQIPSTMAPHNLLAVFWDDMNPYAGGQVYYYVNEDSAIITWENVPHYYDEGSYTFQIIILASGTVVFQYQSLVGEVNSATVGIQNSDGTIGLQVAYNQEYLHDEMAILFSQRWLRASPSSGVVPPGTTDTVTVTFDGVTLDEAVYTGSLEITGEDIYHSEDPVSVPVRFVVGDPSDVIDGGSSLPTRFALYQNYPNPFNPTTEIRYDIPKDTHVKLEIYNLMGQLVSVPVDGYQKAGHKTIYWDATDQTGSKIASGIYFYRLDTDNFKKSRKMTILK